MPYAEYMAIMEEGDICLDSYHFGGFNVLIDGLYLQKPSVVFEGKRWYSRSGAALMRKLGLGELVVKTPTEYSQLTLKLIGDRNFYESMQDKVRQIDLQNIAFQPMNGQYFKKAIAFLIQNHDRLKSESSKKAIRIA
jgi:predicted O-linked N-acetylglucosamine transferase (SPINDLY family)